MTAAVEPPTIQGKRPTAASFRVVFEDGTVGTYRVEVDPDAHPNDATVEVATDRHFYDPDPDWLSLFPTRLAVRSTSMAWRLGAVLREGWTLILTNPGVRSEQDVAEAVETLRAAGWNVGTSHGHGTSTKDGLRLGGGQAHQQHYAYSPWERIPGELDLDPVTEAVQRRAE